MFHCTAPRVHHIENLSELEQRLFYTRVLCTHFNFLYQHLDTPAILNTLHERGLITTVTFGAIKMLSEKYAQNARAIQNMQMITAPPNCAEKLCEILDQNHVAKVIYSGKLHLQPLHFILLYTLSIIILQNMSHWQCMVIHSPPKTHMHPLLSIPCLAVSPVHS